MYVKTQHAEGGGVPNEIGYEMVLFNKFQSWIQTDFKGRRAHICPLKL